MTTMTSTDELTMKVSQMQEALDRMEHKVDQNNAIMNTYATKKGLVKAEEGEEEGDENKERGNWSGQLDFLLSCLGYAVGLGNVWRFPFLAYENGGGAFFIPYCIMLGIVGIPIFFMELSIGQFSSCGPTKCWGFAPIFQGVGYGMMVVSSLVAIYYNMIIAWAFYYLFASFTDDLPWSDCSGSWANKLCRFGKENDTDWINNCTQISNNMTVFNTIEKDGSCRDSNGEAVHLWDVDKAKEEGLKYMLPSDQYFNYEVLGKTEGKGLEDMGEMHWELVLCLLLAWIFVALTLSKGIKSSGKVVYVTATFPYLVLIILLVRGVTLDGYYDGIKFYIEPTVDRLSDAKVWKDAAVQIFFSLSASWGGLIALSSYNRFHNDVFRDSLIVSFGNCLTSLFAGFVIFSFLGFLAHETDQEIDQVASGGTGLAFVVYPAAVSEMPISPLWAILFFLMLVTLGVDSEFVLVETVVTSFMDMVPSTRKYKTFVVFSTCFIFFILGLPLCCDGGQDLLDLVDTYAGGWNVLVISLCECIGIGWVYGVRRFLNDIETMVGTKVCGIMPWFAWKWWWAVCWCVLTPIGVTFILIFSWVDYTRIERLPHWADAIGWIITMTVIVAIFGTMVVLLVITPGSMKQKLRTLTTPTREWGPALPKHRQLVTYVDDFDVDPSNSMAPENGGPADPQTKYYTNHAMDMYEK